MNRILFIVAAIFLATGCVSNPANPQDPYEDWNRSVYQFNKSLDNAVTKPLAKGYKAVTPDIVEKGISNIFSNIGDIPNMLNNLLQGEFQRSASDLGRLLINSTIGIAGIWDPATKMGLEKHDEDFGQTLGVWGVEPGPYLMLPIMGPSTLRDFSANLSGYAFDGLSETDGDNWEWVTNPIKQLDHIPTRNQLLFLDLLDKRARLLEYEEQLKNAADEYAFIRDVYLQNRRFKVFNGDLPIEDDFDECEDEEEEDCDF